MVTDHSSHTGTEPLTMGPIVFVSYSAHDFKKEKRGTEFQALMPVFVCACVCVTPGLFFSQGRQKLARFNAREFATLIIDILSDAKRRQQGKGLSPTGETGREG